MSKKNAECIKLLLIEDNPSDCMLIQEMLRDARTSFEFECVDGLSKGLERLAEVKFDVLLLDLGLSESTGMDTLKRVLAHNFEVPIVVLTGYDSDQLGLEAIKEGAQDYLAKGRVDTNLLMRSIRYAIERQRLLSELHNQSLKDYLTGLNNRRGFFTLSQQQVKAAKRSKRALLIVVADLDGLKQINDTFGHESGDQALSEVARILKKTFRDSDIIGRIGGDEFAVCVIEEDRSAADAFAARLQENIDAFNSGADRPYKLSISAGIARLDTESDRSVDEMLAEADKLMYEEKRHKRNISSISLSH